MGLTNRIDKLEQGSGINSNRASGDACRCPTVGYETQVILPNVDGSPVEVPPDPPRICQLCGRQQRITTVVVLPDGKTYSRES
jgi:hypothetical protein